MAPNYPFKLSNPDLFQELSYVDGRWVQARSGHRFEIEDPGTGEVFASCADFGVDDIDDVVQSSQRAFLAYRNESPNKRARKLLEWDRLIRENRDDIAQVLTHETGKPLAEAQGELEYALGFTWWFAGEAERIRGSIATSSLPNRRVFVHKQPIGVAAALVPWNFPVAMILRKVGAALAAGCTMIAKPSPETPLTTLILAKLASQAGFAPGVFNVVTTSLKNTPAVAEALCKHALVKKVSFTGSTKIGSLVAKHCAEGLKKVSLELGGNCPFLIFDDCDQQQALDALTALKWRHAGQACITANRVYVQDGIFDEFAQKLVEQTKGLKIGHGTQADTTMGPLTTRRGMEKAQSHVQNAISGGATVLYGGKTGGTTSAGQSLTGFFHEPTVLSDMKSHMTMSCEETFGPILGLYRFKTEEEVVAAANDTDMGLASYFFTKNVDRTWRLLESLEAGMIGMNTGNSSAAESPFGGMKMSGYGKESGKDVAVEEYLISKTGTMTVDMKM